jgi:hypothetical protein
MQEKTTKDLREQTKQLLDGPLKHIRGAALAAALLPLASIAAAPASAQSVCPASGGVCGTVFDDLNHDGIQQLNEPGLPGITVTITDRLGNPVGEAYTGTDGTYVVPPLGDQLIVFVQVPVGKQTSPTNVDDLLGSDGVNEGAGFSVVRNVSGNGSSFTSFGFFATAAKNPGTGTPGYWKNHPEAWPVASITVGGVPYTRDEAIAWLGKVGKDKTTTMFSSLVPAMLNIMIDNDRSCIDATIAEANKWMATYGPVGSGVAASSEAWLIGEPMHQTMDAYNNGRLCAPHRK